MLTINNIYLKTTEKLFNAKKEKKANLNIKKCLKVGLINYIMKHKNKLKNISKLKWKPQ